MRWLPGLLALVACTTRNPVYCDTESDCAGRACDRILHTCVRAAVDAGGMDAPVIPCSTEVQCASFPDTPHCLAPTCVACRDAQDCMGGKSCTAQHVCAPCARDTDCDGTTSGACEGGACLPKSDVAWADCDRGCAGGARSGDFDNPTCTLAEAVAIARPVVVVAPGSSAATCPYAEVGITGDRRLEIFGRGATIRMTAGRSGLEIYGATTSVTAHRLTIDGTGSVAGSGVYVHDSAQVTLDQIVARGMTGSTDAGVYASTAGSVIVRRSLLLNNRGWGLIVSMTPTYAIENTVIAGNGSTTAASAGGVWFESGAGTTSRRFVFNTVARNQTLAASGVGIKCDVAVDILNSLIPDNDVTVSPAGMCFPAASVLATANPARDPTLIFYDYANPELTTMPCHGLHVDPTRPQAMRDVVGKGLGVQDPMVDLDGEPRSPSAPTPGADEPLPCR
jgi:hypothetical protein